MSRARKLSEVYAERGDLVHAAICREVEDAQEQKKEVTLLPCPFCGARPKELFDGLCVTIHCLRRGCGAKIERHLYNSRTAPKAKKMAVVAWNRRSAS